MCGLQEDCIVSMENEIAELKASREGWRELAMRLASLLIVEDNND